MEAVWVVIAIVGVIVSAAFGWTAWKEHQKSVHVQEQARQAQGHLQREHSEQLAKAKEAHLGELQIGSAARIGDI
ncbi:hypothetical protein ODZ83_11130 [Acaricomes phytoseiuli]|uniref:hypothetical protein n=1 Tax=Acaricomes phytoseiuli TaxID=291968 RepID=UPI002221EDD2|nr:hypothetical protein [Acaricomes phytoseiuli]MCW1250711.1 hypothetical protein [Acaricomes phytoseiuli]